MRLILSTAAVLAALFMPISGFAQNAQQKMVFLRVPDSLKDTEVFIGKILLEKLKVNSSLQMRKDNADDLVLRVRFNENKEKNTPAIVVLIDTRILGRDKDNKPTSQVISIASFADVKAKKEKLPALLEWANKLNGQTIPMRVYLTGEKIVVGRNLFNSRSAPLSENAVTVSFSSVIRAWGGLLVDLKKREFIE
jgi:hypothetical protein